MTSITRTPSPLSFSQPYKSVAGAIPAQISIEKPLTAREQGDRQLATNIRNALHPQDRQYNTRVQIPANSTLGQWQQQLARALLNPAFQDWLKDSNINPSSVVVHPDTNSISVIVNNQRVSFRTGNDLAWNAAAAPVLDAGKVLAAGNGISLSYDDAFRTNLELKTVGQFYGLQTSADYDQLDRTQTFPAIAASDPYKSDRIRGEDQLKSQRGIVDHLYKLQDTPSSANAQQAQTYKHLALTVADALPNVRVHAKRWAESLIFRLTGKLVDADTLYLNRFNGSQSASTATGWEHMNEEPTSSLRLPDALLKNFSENDWVPGNLDSESGIYKDGPGQSKTGGYGTHNQFPLAPSTLMHASWKTDFQAKMTQEIGNFWNAHSDDYQAAIKGEFAYQARKQLKTVEARPPAEQALQAPEHRFTREDYRLVMGAASNLPLDENAPLNVEQLRAKAPVKGIVQAHAFNIKGFLSNDIVRFSAADGGRQALYIPGAEPAFLRFDSLEKLDQWVIDQTKDPKKRESLVAHFPLISRQDHESGTIERLAKVFMPVLWFTNVGTKTEGLDTTLGKLSSGELKDPTFNGDGSHIEGDVFSAMTSASKERMTSDADVMIKSNSEVTRDTWLNDITVAAGLLAKLAPIAAPVAAAAVVTGLTELALGEEKQYSGDTLAERNDGASKAFDGLLNTLFSVGASGRVEDPFTPPEETSANPKPGEPPQIESPQSVPGINRLQPSQSGNISQYAVQNGEQLIENATRNAKGIYQVKDATTGSDQWFIRYTDTTGVRQVYEIKGDFKLSNDYMQIIDRDTGKPVLTVHSGGDGEWIRTTGNGGARWPWQRTPSPTPSNDLKISPKFSDQFVELDGSKMTGADRVDKYLKVNEGGAYEFSSRNYEENAIIKRNLNVSWNIDERGFSVESGEKAQFTEHSTNEYSPNFVLDINRNPYTVITKENGREVSVALDGTADSAEGIRQSRLKQFEAAIAPADLRARISEVAHQGSIAPATINLNGESVLQDGYYFGADDTHFYIEHDPSKDLTQVRIISKGHLSNPEQDINHVPGVEVTISRTFTIRESNELEGSFAIDKNAPTQIEVSVQAQ
ncbi:hypothetical protein HKK55_20735 [Pseudomonas sp. ADAK18]|uniref:dermonecrotic toxin domain-containing protein n=1 Tax=Pseudomonas sp. ADAK18 TaxID=2730848 RepID=UPI001464789C|nr:DUF6543 domain-containing protein [Pseudomonas sp. ADAK18]QJI31031.1 hypothetical protein HKK55_20735 [Pseudomonas sp. ADAK18]